jgi:hypothetical protein
VKSLIFAKINANCVKLGVIDLGRGKVDVRLNLKANFQRIVIEGRNNRAMFSLFAMVKSMHQKAKRLIIKLFKGSKQKQMSEKSEKNLQIVFHEFFCEFHL